MAQAFGKLVDNIFGKLEIRIVMHGLDCAGKATILYKLQNGVVPSDSPTVGFSAEEVRYQDMTLTILDIQNKRKDIVAAFMKSLDQESVVVKSLLARVGR